MEEETKTGADAAETATEPTQENTGSLEVGEGLNLFNPLTSGLGFTDTVSQGVYTMKIEPNATESSDGGSLDIGREQMDDGVLNIGVKGEVKVESSDLIQPALFHSGHDGLIKRTAKKSGESFVGALIDVMLLLAFSILSAAIATEFTSFKFDFEQAFQFHWAEIGKLVLIFAAFFLSYKILARVFYGRTLGEWSSRHQMGLILQQHAISYPMRVLARESVCLLTGVFLFPLLSSFIRKDIGFYFSGLQTYIEQKKR